MVGDDINDTQGVIACRAPLNSEETACLVVVTCSVGARGDLPDLQITPRGRSARDSVGGVASCERRQNGSY